jgi:peroxiredoxin
MSGLVAAGTAAPAFELKSLRGGVETLAGLTASGPVALAFFKVSCPVCQYTLPFLERIAAGTGLRIVAVSQDEAEATRRFAERYAPGLEILLDEARNGYPASNGYGISMVPTLFVVEPDGTVSMAAEGFSKKHIAELGRRAGVPPFRDGESIPAWKAG